VSAPEDIDRALGELYGALEAELAFIGAACEACGRCCRFSEFGHQLWLTDAELAYLVARHGVRARADHSVCPYLEDGKCSAHDGRALSCRTFHCSLARDVVEEITERYLATIRALAARAGRPLAYSELSTLLTDEYDPGAR
jgi:Fe-S-cluster containining protein